MSAVNSNPRDFVFATCAPASNAWLKRDVARVHPELRFAYSRPGLLTWKASELPLQFVLQSPIARLSGFSVGRAADTDEVVALLRGCAWGKKPALHVIELASLRESEAGAEPVSALDTGARARAWTAELHACLPGFFAPGEPAVGAPVVDVVLRKGGEPAEPALVGYHLQRRDRPALPGGIVACIAPAESPSRAYSKLVELFGLAEIASGAARTAVELGAAPGGGTLALLERGVNVTAIDPAPVDLEVSAYVGPGGARVVQLNCPAAEVQRQQLPRSVDLLVTDVNLAPAVSLRYVERIAKLISGPRLAILMTLKVNDAKVETALPTLLEQARALGQRFGLNQLRAMQLPSHRREIGVVLIRR